MSVVSPSEEDRFVASVERSWEAAWRVARHIHRKGGLTIELAPLVIRPNFAARTGYGDVADVIVSNAARRWLVEVKWRDIEFTSGEDYPYRTVFVDRSTKIESAAPDLYYSVNKGMTHAARISRATKPFWLGPNEYSDRIKSYSVTVHECPLSLASFVALR